MQYNITRRSWSKTLIPKPMKEQLEQNESNSQANATRTQVRLDAQLLRTRPIVVNTNSSGFENFNHSSFRPEDLVTLIELISREKSSK